MTLQRHLLVVSCDFYCHIEIKQCLLFHLPTEKNQEAWFQFMVSNLRNRKNKYKPLWTGIGELFVAINCTV